MLLLANKKGVESFPFFLFLTVLIAAVVLTISFYQLQTFSEFSSKKEMADGYNELVNTMENLRATSDPGSFKKVNLKIPGNYNIEINSTNDTITIKGEGDEIVNELDFDIIYTTVPKLEPGSYNIEVFYGNFTGTPEPYTIYFI